MSDAGGESWPERQRELLDLLRTGDTISAIRKYRGWAGADLPTAKAAIEELERKGTIPAPPSPAPRVPELPPKFEMELLKLLQNQQKIEAIKRYREHAGCGLKEAKDTVEEIGRRHGMPVGGGCAGVVLLAIAGGLAWAGFLV
jgi:ribosomal protein L7/L12